MQMEWYATLMKPEWAPPAWLFGPVWTVLYIIIAISYTAVLVAVWRGQIPKLVALPFILNLLFNFAFTPIQFGLQNNWLAAVDIVLVLLTLIWALWAIYPYQKWVTFCNLPYLAWVGFATVLQLAITFIN